MPAVIGLLAAGAGGGLVVYSAAAGQEDSVSGSAQGVTFVRAAARTVGAHPSHILKTAVPSGSYVAEVRFDLAPMDSEQASFINCELVGADKQLASAGSLNPQSGPRLQYEMTAAWRHPGGDVSVLCYAVDSEVYVLNTTLLITRAASVNGTTS